MSGQGIITNLVEETELVNSFGLQSVYPNPFNSTTTIRFSLAHISDVEISLYDVSGREFAKLVKGRKSAGVHQAIGTVQICRQGCTLFDCIQVCQLSAVKRC